MSWSPVHCEIICSFNLPNEYSCSMFVVTLNTFFQITARFHFVFVLCTVNSPHFARLDFTPQPLRGCLHTHVSTPIILLPLSETFNVKADLKVGSLSVAPRGAKPSIVRQFNVFQFGPMLLRSPINICIIVFS